MKNYILFLFTLISCSYPKAQEVIYPLETKGFPISGAYYKDIYNELDPFLGTWKGTKNGKTFIITFTKIKDYSPNDNYSKDRLVGKYKILDSNNNIIYDTTNLSNQDSKIISLGFTPQKKSLWFTYLDFCIEGDIYINKDHQNQNLLNYGYSRRQVIVTKESGCADNIEVPTGQLTLVKQ